MRASQEKRDLDVGEPSNRACRDAPNVEDAYVDESGHVLIMLECLGNAVLHVIRKAMHHYSRCSSMGAPMAW
jgi:hypothetical protein